MQLLREKIYETFHIYQFYEKMRINVYNRNFQEFLEDPPVENQRLIFFIKKNLPTYLTCQFPECPKRARVG